MTNPALCSFLNPTIGMAALLCSVLGACGGAPPPTDQLTSSQAAIRAAEEVGSKEDPQAALYLKLAREQVEKAKALMEDNENEQAQRLLQRAEADAELALTLAKQRSMRADAQEAIQQVDQVKSKTSK